MKNFKSLMCALSLATALTATACCSTADKCCDTSKPKYEDNWESLAQHNKEPEWFKDSKLGIYFHWGVYSVPAFGSEWYPHYMYNHKNQHRKKGRPYEIYNHHITKYGKDFDYHDFIPMFTGEAFDPKEWAELFKDAGAKFAGPAALHHDGFAMWDSKVNPWNAKDMGPKRNILGELFKELNNVDMKTIATFHHARTLQRYAKDTTNWYGAWNSHFAYGPDLVTSSTDPKLRKLYGNMPADEFHEYWLEELREVIQGYNPDIIWFDTWLDRIPDAYLKKMVAMQYNNKEESIITYKHEDLPRNLAVMDIEQGGMKEMPFDYWMTDITLSYSSWSYVTGQTYKPVEMVVRNMIDVWSKRGIVLLNISPRADGVIPDEQRAVLADMGKWIRKYEEAIYGTRSHYIYGYGTAAVEDNHHGGQKATLEYTNEDVRYTRSKDGNTLYAFVLGMPDTNSPITFKSVMNGDKKSVRKVTVMGSNKPVKWTMNDEDFELTVTTPSSEADMDALATIFKIEF